MKLLCLGAISQELIIRATPKSSPNLRVKEHEESWPRDDHAALRNRQKRPTQAIVHVEREAVSAHCLSAWS